MMEFLMMFKDYIGLALIVLVATVAIILIAKYVTRSVFKQIEEYHNKRDEKVIGLAIQYIGAVCGIFVQTFRESTKVVEGEETTTEKIMNLLMKDLK